MARKAVDFPTFFALWADERGWTVPDVHWRVVDFLATRGHLALLRCHRGLGKSTLLGIYNAWRFYDDPTYRILHQGDQDGTAYKTARDTRAVLLRHPLTRDMAAGIRGEVSFWWVPGANDERNPSIQAAGILSNITSSRADEIQNDDVEVPRNIATPDARNKLRFRLDEQTHILVPGGRTLYVGTPHTHDSLYNEIEAMGADCLSIPLFAQEHRIMEATERAYAIPFVPEYVFAGIGKHARLLREGFDYTMTQGGVQFIKAPGMLVDFYSGCAWPERFTLEDLQVRRQKTRTINYWDSQYQLHARPLHEIRLDPDRMPVYDVEPRIESANRQAVMWLGRAKIVGAALRWDPAAGKLKSDVSALALVLQDEQGRRYWHRAIELEGEVVEFDNTGKRITGGQVAQIAEVVERYQLHRVTIETNGIGQFGPSILAMALKQRGLVCGVSAVHATANKEKRILEALEPLITTGMLWAHSSVSETSAYQQFREWNPAMTGQADDHPDVLAGAVTETPERVGHLARTFSEPMAHDWRPNAGVFEATLEL